MIDATSIQNTDKEKHTIYQYFFYQTFSECNKMFPNICEVRCLRFSESVCAASESGWVVHNMCDSSEVMFYYMRFHAENSCVHMSTVSGAHIMRCLKWYYTSVRMISFFYYLSKGCILFRLIPFEKSTHTLFKWSYDTMIAHMKVFVLAFLFHVVMAQPYHIWKKNLMCTTKPKKIFKFFLFFE